jgi:hypothetical protein
VIGQTAVAASDAMGAFMTTRKLDLLRTGYRGACKAYQTHAKVIDETARRGRRPLDGELRAEEHALRELTKVRRKLLAAISDLPLG